MIAGDSSSLVLKLLVTKVLGDRTWYLSMDDFQEFHLWVLLFENVTRQKVGFVSPS